jgi:diacylglycerol kinase family enzyme
VTVALIVNPRASGVSPELAVAVERELRVAGHEVETQLTERAGHAVELAFAASGRGERIFVYGGDGAFNEVVNGVEGDVAVGFIPGGATNVLSRAIGLPRDPVACARHLARSRRERRISLGRVNGRRFTFGAGVGLDAELVRRGDALGRLNGRRAGDIVLVRTLVGMLARRRGRLEPVMTVLGRDRVAFALVANCDPYSYAGPFPIHAAPRARFELGLDLVAPRGVAPWELPLLTAWALTGRGQASSPRVLYLHDADEVAVECDSPLPLQADGEDLGDVSTARFEAQRDALRVLVGDN